MDARVRAKVGAIVAQLRETLASELAGAVTMAELEGLTVEIGNEITRQLCEEELQNRGKRAAQLKECECPVCHQICPQKEMEPAVLQGLRGELVFNHPAYVCRQCRRSFFPSPGAIGGGSASHGDASVEGEDGVGGDQLGEL